MAAKFALSRMRLLLDSHSERRSFPGLVSGEKSPTDSPLWTDRIWGQTPSAALGLSQPSLGGQSRYRTHLAATAVKGFPALATVNRVKKTPYVSQGVTH